MELNVISGLTVLLLMLVLGGLFVVIAARSGAMTNFEIALEQQGLEWTVVVAICLVGLGGLTAGAMVGAPLLGDGATVASVAGGTLFLAGTGIAGLAIGRYPQYRRLTSADSTTVQGCAVGDTVVLTGTVDSDGDLVAPCTETSCVAYDARIETQARTLQPSMTCWIVDDRRTDSHPFSMTDETGRITIDPTEARVRVPLDPISSAETTTLLLRRAFTGASVSPDGSSSRYTEGTLEAGDPVSVVGRVVDGRSLEGSHSQRVIDAESVSAVPIGERVLRSTVRRNGTLGLGLGLGGGVLMLAAAGIL